MLSLHGHTKALHGNLLRRYRDSYFDLIELADHRSAVITVHPSYLLRLLEDRDKRREFDRLVKDLRFAADAADKSP